MFRRCHCRLYAHHPRLLASHPKSSPPLRSCAMQSSTPQQQTMAAEEAAAYHERTKHSLTSGYARGPRGLDWASQPNPFLHYSPSVSHLHRLLHLPPRPASPPLYPTLFSSPPSNPSPISLPALSQLLYDSLSLSAWKAAGASTWSLRVNPSSGNLHPTEAHLLCPPLPELGHPSPFLAHYSPKDHSLDFLLTPTPPLPIPDASVMVSLSSIFWRESWKYGERALRYCNHDVGHALAALAISAAALGWDATLLDGLGHEDVHNFLGLDQWQMPFVIPDRPTRGRLPWVEQQHPDCLLLIFPHGTQGEIDYPALSTSLSEFKTLRWNVQPNSLSKEHVCWDIIYKSAEAIKKPLTPVNHSLTKPYHPSSLLSEEMYKGYTVREVVRKRRSAVDMDGIHVMNRDTFYQIMLRCLPSGELKQGKKQGKQFALPFRIMTWDAEVHAVLFVHRVENLPKGLYFLVRNEEHLDRLKRAMRSEFEWKAPHDCPANLPLYRLVRGDFQKLAKQLSCHQDIACDGCFSLGMLAHFEPVLHEKGAWMYPRLFWESGILGQVLYLEAHAVGISATGIGCYFDDGVHEVLGLKSLEFQSLYHFTVGAPVVDKRIMSLPAYPGPDIDA